MKKEANASGGMSRAAKKRAKKKQKKYHSVVPKEQSESVEEEDTKLPSDEESKEPAPKKIRIEKEGAHNKPRENGESDDDQAEAFIETLTSMDHNLLLPECNSLREILLVENQSLDTPFHEMSAKKRARCVLDFLLKPANITTDEFYAEYWEKKPLCVQASTDPLKRRLDGLLSLANIRSMLEKHNMYYGHDLNVTRYEKASDGVKRRANMDLVKAAVDEDANNLDNYVRVDPEVLWTHYQQGCTVRLLCPQNHATNVHALLSLLELEWGCMVGANAYLTPPSQSQGFAPHYDDIEAFCLQLEGCKRWKVYEPNNKAEVLPRVSSEDYTEEDLRGIEPVMDVVLNPGDMLYMPRGWIHQACTLPVGQDDNNHSLHLTVSAMQQWAWVDLMEILLPEALQAAASSETSTSLRAGLPRGFLDFMGVMHDNRDEPELLQHKNDDKEEVTDLDPEEVRKAEVKRKQEQFRVQAKKRIMRVAKEAFDMLDAACDEMGKRFLSDRLPPALTPRERSETDQTGSEPTKILPQTLCRLVRPGIARLVIEGGKAVLYHCADNSPVYHEHPLSPMEFEVDDAPAIEQLLTTTEPHWIGVADLIHDSIEDKVGVAQALYDEGILAVRTMEL